MMKRLVLGIDGGGTKTVTVLGDRGGNILGRGVGGPANYLKEGLYTAKGSLRQAVETALEKAGVEASQIAVVCAGLAGMDRPKDREVMARVFEELLPGTGQVLVNDALIALAGATEGKSGLIVISGTGSIALGVNEQGQQARSGGWGHLVGDEGSAFDIARKGLMAALHDLDGRGPSTGIRDKLMRELYLNRTEDLIPLIYSELNSPSRIAALFPLILEAAEARDPVACGLIDEAAEKLVEAAVAVVHKLSMEAWPFPVAVTGGVFLYGPLLKRRFAERLRLKIPNARLTDPLHAPEIGALLLARAALKGEHLFGTDLNSAD